MGAHKHKWWLAEHAKGSLIKLGKATLGWQNGQSIWLCECGASKQVKMKQPKTKEVL